LLTALLIGLDIPGMRHIPCDIQRGRHSSPVQRPEHLRLAGHTEDGNERVATVGYRMEITSFTFLSPKSKQMNDERPEI